MMVEKLVFRIHALQRMAQRRISPNDIRQSLEQCMVVEDYPDDTPYPSCLVLGWIGKRPLHIVKAENIESRETIVITVYEPDSSKWMPGFMRRKP
jgi:hypothetical protein